MSHTFFEVDVFATDAFTGNPLAVIAGADDLSSEQMQNIARWLNLSETTFLLEPTTPEADYRVRIFTQSEEFPFAGHPTLGTARAWLTLNSSDKSELIQECGAGLIPVKVDGDRLAFAAPPRTRTGELPGDEVATIVDTLRISEDEIVAHAWGVNGPQWRLVQLGSIEAVRNLRPTAPEPGRHIGVVAVEGEVAEVRAFVDNAEDPVTGSLNAALAQWLRERGEVGPEYVAWQGRCVGADGAVYVHDDGADIWIGGTAEVRVRGELV